MSILSIAERELRVAARKRTTYSLRLFVSGVALIVTSFLVWIMTLLDLTKFPGEKLFAVITLLAYACAALIGCSLTADAISEEKREGTLGLLFLTNLRGYSIALGKLAGHGLLSFYSVVSIIPIMAIPILFGGADLASVLKTMLAIFNVLSFSLAIGLLFSTLCRRGWVALGGSIVVLGLFTIAIPLLSEVLRISRHGALASQISRVSPTYLFLMASPNAAGLRSNYFWSVLAFQTGGLVILLCITCALLSIVWRDRPASACTGPVRGAWDRLRYGGPRARTEIRNRLSNLNPITWLCARQRFGGAGFTLFICCIGIIATFITDIIRIAAPPKPGALLPAMFVWFLILPVLYLCFCFRLAAAASERFGADRRSGALELILSTPISVRDLIQGQWLALFRQFWGPALLLLLLHFFALHYFLTVVELDFGHPANLMEAARATARHLIGGQKINGDTQFAYLIPIILTAAGFLIVILWISLGWTAMCLGLKARKQLTVPITAILVLAISPLPPFIFFGTLIGYFQFFQDDLLLHDFVLGTIGFLLVLTNALIWLFHSRAWLYRNFRAAATDRYHEAAPKRFFRLV